MKEKNGFWIKIKAYHMYSQVWVIIVLALIFVLSVVVYQLPDVRGNEVAANLLLALFTSLLVTIFTMTADLFVNYRNHLSEEYLEDMHSFGISNLFQDKKKALQGLLSDCDKTIWISGYRLILTRDLIPDIRAAINRGAKVTAVICPPWSVAYNMVYGDNSKVMDNYYKVFYGIYQEYKAKEFPLEDCKVYFVNKPIFSDTYRVDQNLITGPYMHNRDGEFLRLMAKDFFSYDIVRQSKLYNIVNDEFGPLCDDALEVLDFSNIEAENQRFEKSDWTEAQKREEFHKLCKKL